MNRLILAACLTLCACAATPDPGPANQTEAPRSLQYVGSPFTYTVGTRIEADLPSWDGGTPTSFAVSPALPGGITFNTTTGAIAGTPGVESENATYTVTATNDIGSTTGTIQVKVNPAPVAPTGLHYSLASASYVLNVAIPDNIATLAAGTTPITYTVSPALPAGLSLNASTGTISGTPTSLQVTQQYTVTATNTQGHTSAVVSIAVTATLLRPDITGYLQSPVTYSVGSEVSPINTPVLGGGPATSFTVNPTLPTGLTFNTTNGHIGGTPSEIAAAADYTITASNATGPDQTPFLLNISVAMPSQPVVDYPATAQTFASPGTRIPTISPATAAQSGWHYEFESGSDALPMGLSLNPNTGVISGIPQSDLSSGARSNYVVKAANGALSATGAVAVTFSAPTGTVHTIQVEDQGIGCPQINSGATLTVDKGDSVAWSASVSISNWNIDITSDNNAFAIASPLTDSETEKIGINEAGVTYGWHANHVGGNTICSNPPGGTITVNSN